MSLPRLLQGTRRADATAHDVYRSDDFHQVYPTVPVVVSTCRSTISCPEPERYTRFYTMERDCSEREP